MPIDFRASQIQTNKIIASGSTGTETGAQLVIYPHSADDGTAPNQGFIDQSVFVTSSIGTDIFLYVSGGIGERNVGGTKSISVFGGDLHVSGNLTIDGTYPAGGGGGSGTSFYRLEVLDYAAVNATGSTTVGQVIFPANQFTGSLVLYGVIANQLSTATGSVQLYNVTSGSYVEIGGAGITHLFVTGTVPTIISSINLISASNFNSSSQSVYELQVSSSNGGSYAFFGGFELRPSGSFTGISYITSSVYNNYISGTWEDGGNRLATTSSVAIAGNLGTGYFADNVGNDVYFFVSGNNGGVAAGNGVSVFGGDVVMSGTLFGGSPLKIGTKLYINGASNGDSNGNLIQFDNSSSIGGIVSVASNPATPGLSSGNLTLTLNAGNAGDLAEGGMIEINAGAGAGNPAGNGFNSGDVIINGRVGGNALVDGSAYTAGTGGDILLVAGNGGDGGIGGAGGVVNLVAGDGGNGNDAAPVGIGGAGGGINISAGDGQIGQEKSGIGGNVIINAGNSTSGGVSGSNGGYVLINGGYGSDSYGPAGSGGDVYIIAGQAGLDNNTNLVSGSGNIEIAGGLHPDIFHYLSASNLTIGRSAGSGFSYQFRRAFFNRIADESIAANLALPSPTEIPDVFFYVSGGIGQKNGSIPTIAAFGGDLHVSGNLTVDGTYPSGGGSGLATGKQYIASATTTTTTTALMIGQFSWVPSDYTGLTSVRVRAIMSTDGTANHTGSLQIYNLTSGSYLDLIDTPSTSTYFDITSSIPTLVTSSNLLTGITNFDNNSIAVYEVRVSGSTANNTIIGGVELIFS